MTLERDLKDVIAKIKPLIQSPLFPRDSRTRNSVRALGDRLNAAYNKIVSHVGSDMSNHNFLFNSYNYGYYKFFVEKAHAKPISALQSLFLTLAYCTKDKARKATPGDSERQIRLYRTLTFQDRDHIYLPDTNQDSAQHLRETIEAWQLWINTAQVVSQNRNFVDFIDQLMCIATEAIRRFAMYLPEVYTSEHIRTWQSLDSMIKQFLEQFELLKETNPLAYANLNSAKYLILKKLFHLLVRPHPEDEMDIPNREPYVSLKKGALETMGNSCNVTRKFLKKAISYTGALGKDAQRKMSDNFLDSLIIKYYKALYLDKKPTSALKVLMWIFDYIRGHQEHISKKQVEYFTGELELLSSFIKLVIMQQELEKASKDTAIPEWMRKTYSDISLSLLESIRKNFKYEIPHPVDGKRLRIRAQTTCGRFLEFLISYLLKELVEVACKFSSNQSWPEGIKELCASLHPPLKAKDIKINYRPIPNGPDLDVLVVNRCFISLKSGSIDKGDLSTFKRELATAKAMQLPQMFFAYDTAFALNHSVENQIKTFAQLIGVEEFCYVLDVKLLLESLFKFVKLTPDIELPLGKSMLFELTGLQE